MRRFLAPSSGLDKFFAAQFSAGYITNMSGFDLRQAQEGKIRPKACLVGDLRTRNDRLALIVSTSRPAAEENDPIIMFKSSREITPWC